MFYLAFHVLYIFELFPFEFVRRKKQNDFFVLQVF